MDTRALLLLGILAASTGGTACSGITELHFDVNKAIPSGTITPMIATCQLTNPIGVSVLSAPFQMAFSQSQDFPSENTDLGHIDSVTLSSLSLSLSAASPQRDWSFLTQVDLYIQSQNNPQKLVACVGDSSTPLCAGPVPAGTATLSLHPTGVELAPYVKDNGGFQISSQASGCPPSQDADYSGAADFSVSASPL